MQSEVDDGRSVSGQTLLRLGVVLYLLGRHTKAMEYLSRVPDDATASFFRAQVLTALEQHEEAQQKFEEAAQLGYDAVDCTLRRAGAIRALGRLDEAESMLRSG